MIALLAVTAICLADCIGLCGQWELIGIYDAQGKKHLDGLDLLFGEEYIFRNLSIDLNTLTFGKNKKSAVVYGLVIHPLETPKGFDLLVPKPKKEVRLPGIYKITTHNTLKLKVLV